MVFPPPTLPIDRVNASPSLGTHPSDHNALGLAFNDITSHLTGTLAIRKQHADGGSIPNSTWTLLTVPTLVFNHGVGLSGGSHMILSNPGFFLLFGYVHWNDPGPVDVKSRRIIGYTTTTTTTPTNDFQDGAAGISDFGQIQQACIPFPLRTVEAGGTTIYMWAFQDSGKTMTLESRDSTVLRLTPEL